MTAPGLVPGILAIVIVAFGLVMLVRSVRTGALAAGGGAEREGGGGGESTRRLVLMLVLSVGYAGFLVGLIPFWLATLAYVFVTVSVFEWRVDDTRRARIGRLAFALLEAVLVAVVVTLVFERIFLVNLP